MDIREFIKILLPSGVSEYFDIVKVDENELDYVLHLEEKNLPPRIETSDKLESKGFYDTAIVRDFPLRGKACYLKVKRRKWVNMTTGEIVMRDWNVVAQGTRLTKEFAAFLKGTN